MTAREPMRLSSVEFDLVTKSEANERFASKGGMFAKAHRVASQRKAVKEALGKLGAAPSPFFAPAGAAPSFTLPNRIEITITRIGPGTLDAHDNLRVALKAAVDATCEDWIGLRDDDPRVKVLPAQQEKTPGVSMQGPCSVCWAPSGSRCAEGPKGAPMVKGLHAARRTPWRVRIEVRDLAPGPNRIHVCISEEVQKRKKSKPRPPKPATVDGSEDHSARMLVACGTCGAHVGEKCRRIGKGRAVVLHEVHATRALLAGHDVSPLVRSVLAEQAAAVSGFVKGKAPRRIVGPPVVRVAYPWTQPACAGCDGSGRMLVHRPGMPESARFVAACERCKGRGIVGPLFLSIDEAVKATQPDKTYRVPAAHVARWGAQVTLFPRRYRVAALGVVTVFELKDRR